MSHSYIKKIDKTKIIVMLWPITINGQYKILYYLVKIENKSLKTKISCFKCYEFRHHSIILYSMKNVY